MSVINCIVCVCVCLHSVRCDLFQNTRTHTHPHTNTNTDTHTNTHSEVSRYLNRLWHSQLVILNQVLGQRHTSCCLKNTVPAGRCTVQAASECVVPLSLWGPALAGSCHLCRGIKTPNIQRVDRSGLCGSSVSCPNELEEDVHKVSSTGLLHPSQRNPALNNFNKCGL